MKASLLRGSVVRSSRARRSCGEAVAGACGRVAHALASAARPSRLAKSRVHSMGRVDDHFVEGRLPGIAGCPPEPREHEPISHSSRWDEPLDERIVEHILWVSRPRPIVEEAELVPNGSLVHFAELFACHKRGVLILKCSVIGS